MSNDYRINKVFPAGITDTQFYVDMIFYVPVTKDVGLIEISENVKQNIKNTTSIIHSSGQKVAGFIGKENITSIGDWGKERLDKLNKDYPDINEDGNLSTKGKVTNVAKTSLKNCNDLVTKVQDVISPTSLKDDTNGDGTVTIEERSVLSKKYLDRICLNLPEEIPSDIIDVSYSARDLGMLGALKDFTKNGKINTDDLLTSVAMKNAGKLASVISNKLEKFTQDAVDIASHDAGVKQHIDNDLVILEGIERRNISVGWKLVVRNRQDAKIIMDIIDFLRIITTPKKRDGILEYPASVLMKFVLAGREFFRYEQAYITNVTTNFSPEGFNYLYDGNPMFYTLDLTIMEQSRKYRDDYVKMINKRRKLEGSKQTIDNYGKFTETTNTTDTSSSISSSNKSEKAKDSSDKEIIKNTIPSN